MLTIRGRLIAPFVLGSMSVGLNILIVSHKRKDILVKVAPVSVKQSIGRLLIPHCAYIYISVGEIELLCGVFLACLEETLYKLRLIRV